MTSRSSRSWSLALNTFLDPIRERRAEFERQPDLLEDILAEGSRALALEARETLRLAKRGHGAQLLSPRPAPVSKPRSEKDDGRLRLSHVAALARMAGTARYAPIYRELLADLETPVSALLKLGAGPGSFLLESVEGGEFVARYSFVAAGLERSLEIYDDRAVYRGAEGAAD